MKTIKFFLLGIMAFCFAIIHVHAQPTELTGRQIKTYKIEVSTQKTTNIVFLHNIVGVDRGNKDLLAQKANGAENILQIKAAKRLTAETNLSVITADGKLTSFIVSYADNPQVLNLSLEQSTAHGDHVFLSGENLNEAEIQRSAEIAAFSKKRMYGILDRNYGMSIELTGFFIHKDIFYCRFQLANSTNINYDIDQFRFFIRDRKKATRTSRQEIEVTPIYKSSGTDKIAGKGADIFVFALPKFTMPDKKYLAVQLMERHGGRDLELHIKNRHVMRATLLPPDRNQAAVQKLTNF